MVTLRHDHIWFEYCFASAAVYLYLCLILAPLRIVETPWKSQIPQNWQSIHSIGTLKKEERQWLCCPLWCVQRRIEFRAILCHVCNVVFTAKLVSIFNKACQATYTRLIFTCSVSCWLVQSSTGSITRNGYCMQYSWTRLRPITDLLTFSVTASVDEYLPWSSYALL